MQIYVICHVTYFAYQFSKDQKVRCQCWQRHGGTGSQSTSHIAVWSVRLYSFFGGQYPPKFYKNTFFGPAVSLIGTYSIHITRCAKRPMNKINDCST